MINPRHSRRSALQILSAGAISTAFLPTAPAAEKFFAATRVTGKNTTKVSILLEVGGDLKLNDQGQPRTLKMNVVGRLEYAERLLETTEQGVPRLVARLYDSASAVIKIDQGSSTPTLRTDRLLIGSGIAGDQTTIFSPQGPLTRDELDLIEVPANSLLVDRLLPGREIVVNDKWQHPNELLASLLGLDAVSESEVFSEFKEQDETFARFDLAGPVNGAINGVATEIKLQGRYKYHLEQGRITWVALLIDEKRSIGHVGPGADVTSRLQMTIEPTATPVELSDAALEADAWNPSPDGTLLEYRSAQGGFAFQHDRRWHVMNATREAASLRLIERGELVAQCNISTLPTIAAGKMTTLAEFQRDIQRTLGKNFGQFLTASEGTTTRNYQMHRVIATGTVSELPIQWNYYLVADQVGHQVVLAFTIENEQLVRLAETDQSIAGSVELSTPTETAATPKTTR